MREHKQYCMIYDMGHSVDGIEFDDFEEAKADAISTLVMWICDELMNWKFDANGIPHPTEEQIESWDGMINDCCCYVAEWNEEAQEFYDEKMNYWFPSYEEEDEINWLEWADLKKKYNW